MEKDENKQKEAGIGPIFKIKVLLKDIWISKKDFETHLTAVVATRWWCLQWRNLSRLIDSAQTAKQINGD